MANEAHKEPTMEEILASIRKIISDDDTSASSKQDAPRAGPAPVAVTDIDFGEDATDDFEDILQSAVDDELEEAMFDAEDEFNVEDHFEVEDAIEEAAEPEPASPSFEDMLGSAKKAETQSTPVASVAPVAPPAANETQPAPMETDMAASRAYEQTILTDEKTADSAAGSLGKLISKMDLGGDNTIEGLVRELLKPMIKEWLDSNLPQIVEQKVEAEVQRIARMAR